MLMRESLGCEWRSATKLKKVITHSCGSSHSFLFAQVTFPLSDWVKGDDRSLDRVRCSDCNRIYRVPTAFDLSTTMVTERFGGAHGRGVGNFVRAGTRGLRVAARVNCPVCSVSCSRPPAVTEIHQPT